MKKTIVKEMLIADMMSTFPHKAQVLAKELSSWGLGCAGCCVAEVESLEEGMLAHGMSEEQVEKYVERLNEIVNSESNPNAIVLTPTAAKKFLAIAKEQSIVNAALRFEDKPGGCSGFEYKLDFSDGALENDEVFVSCGIEIHVSKDAVPRLMGAEIDYVDGLNDSGFKISNPNVKRSCGCGHSQQYK